MYLINVTNCNILFPMKNNIKKVRLKLRMSRKEFSTAIGISLSAISHYERHFRSPRLSICYQVIDLAAKHGININLEDLLPRKSNKS